MSHNCYTTDIAYTYCTQSVLDAAVGAVGDWDCPVDKVYLNTRSALEVHHYFRTHDYPYLPTLEALVWEGWEIPINLTSSDVAGPLDGRWSNSSVRLVFGHGLPKFLGVVVQGVNPRVYCRACYVDDVSHHLVEKDYSRFKSILDEWARQPPKTLVVPHANISFPHR